MSNVNFYRGNIDDLLLIYYDEGSDGAPSYVDIMNYITTPHSFSFNDITRNSFIVTTGGKTYNYSTSIADVVTYTSKSISSTNLFYLDNSFDIFPLSSLECNIKACIPILWFDNSLDTYLTAEQIRQIVPNKKYELYFASNDDTIWSYPQSITLTAQYNSVDKTYELIDSKDRNWMTIGRMENNNNIFSPDWSYASAFRYALLTTQSTILKSKPTLSTNDILTLLPSRLNDIMRSRKIVSGVVSWSNITTGSLATEVKITGTYTFPLKSTYANIPKINVAPRSAIMSCDIRDIEIPQTIETGWSLLSKNITYQYDTTVTSDTFGLPSSVTVTAVYTNVQGATKPTATQLGSCVLWTYFADPVH